MVSLNCSGILYILSAGLNLSGGQEDGREKQNSPPVCEAGAGVHRQAPRSWSHLLRDL